GRTQPWRLLRKPAAQRGTGGDRDECGVEGKRAGDRPAAPLLGLPHGGFPRQAGRGLDRQSAGGLYCQGTCRLPFGRTSERRGRGDDGGGVRPVRRGNRRARALSRDPVRRAMYRFWLCLVVLAAMVSISTAMADGGAALDRTDAFEQAYG